MPAYRDRWRSPELRRWLGTWVALVVCMAVWASTTPLFTGPDEVSQARRAAAVVRGELTGRQDRPGPALLLTVEVPRLYGEAAELNFLCHLGPLLEGAPQEAMALPSPPCPDLSATNGPEGGRLVEAETVQYRGQPFYYALVGVPTLLSDGVAGAYGMRLVGVVVTAALLASALCTAAGSRRGRLSVLGVFCCTTPAVLYLGGSTNPSSVEIAAAVSAWAAVAVLATSDGPWLAAPRARVAVRRLGVALVTLTLCRGLGPAFAAAVVVIGGLAAGPSGVRALLRRKDLRWWAGGVAAATMISGAWLAHISGTYPLPERAGSGFSTALGFVPWYLHQSVGVFGTNDSGVAASAVVVWCVVVVVTVAAGVVLTWRDRGVSRGAERPAHGGRDHGGSCFRTVLLGVALLVGGLVMNVTAEGLSLPPIGFFWQGRYALPLVFGGVVLATTAAAAGPVSPLRSHGDILVSRVAPAAVLVLMAIHVHALLAVADHHGRDGTATLVGALIYLAGLAGAALSAAGGSLRKSIAPSPE